jgi:Domain of unknown function (DUF4258)
MAGPHYVAETQTLQRVVRNPDCRFVWCKHAREQMAARRITAEDVISALTFGQVILEECKRDILWRVDGRDIDGHPLKVVVAVYESTITIKVVTAF